MTPDKKYLKISRKFTRDCVAPFNTVKWNKRTAEITDETGKVIFKQEGIDAPETWSDLAVKVVASKYFYGAAGSAERETSIQQLVHRVCRTIADWAVADGYVTRDDGNVFYDELCWLCIHQYFSFNSPVWFNVGLWHQYKAGSTAKGNWYYVRGSGDGGNDRGQAARANTQYEYPQSSACFLNQVDDNMESIMDLAVREAMLFKFGSGTGTDLTPIRSSREKLSGGGTPSGPLSFLRIYDQVGNVVKSGGKTRRAAKLNVLYAHHGDIEEFIDAKKKEEKKAHALIDAGYDGNFNGEAYGTVAFQNENLSVRVTDEFMRAATATDDKSAEWWTRSVVGNEKLEKKDARQLLRKVAEGTWFCGDPGLQYDDQINKWHTCKGTDKIYTSNPCAEYLFINNTACNLASLNLMKFMSPDGSTFEIERFKDAIELIILAQEVLVDNASYPSPDIAVNSHVFRTLGLGYANLGALIMSQGLPYDSDDARNITSAVTSLLTGTAYAMSAKISEVMGSFPGYNDSSCYHVKSDKTVAPSNVKSMHDVIDMHYQATLDATSGKGWQKDVLTAAAKSWSAAKTIGLNHGFRNAQVTVCAPTGTISFQLDADTTGIEPELGLVKYKFLAGRGMLKLVNRSVPQALEKLGYSADESKRIIDHIEKFDTIEDVGDAKSGLKPEHLAVFDCSFKPKNGKRSIHHTAHIKILAAAQPFFSGSISKTVNVPKEATVEDILETYVLGWKLGLKCVAIYRDGSKRSQPLTTSKDGDGAGGASAEIAAKLAQLEADNKALVKRLAGIGSPVRRRMRDTRNSITHKFDVGGHEGYLTIGMFEDGSPGEVFVVVAKEGSTIGGLMDVIGTLTSIALQYGVPLSDLVEKFSHTRFEPMGVTKDKDVRFATSIIDYMFRWISANFTEGNGHPPRLKAALAPVFQLDDEHHDRVVVDDSDQVDKVYKPGTLDAPLCSKCGNQSTRSGSCYRCDNCGESLGCS